MRQPKTDRLVLSPFLEGVHGPTFIDEGDFATAHAIVVRWADLETKGRLLKLKETQLQAIF